MIRLLPVLALAGCCAAPTVTRVEVPVPVSCAAQVERPSLLTNRELAELDDYRLPLALYRDRIQRMAYEAKLEAAMEACR